MLETAVGYEGGELPHPTYKEVCTDRTGHAEVVEVTFDPERVNYETLLDTFFELHDPTQLNRQGPDFGTQYRSAIFYHSEEQCLAAKKKIEELNGGGPLPQTDRDGGGAVDDLLEGRGVSPEVSGEARHGELPHLRMYPPPPFILQKYGP